MVATVQASELELENFDEILDVRSPAEFAEDHLPGARNLPVLNDEERARVGTIYKQESVFEARKIGASLVSANISRHIQDSLADKPGGYRPLVYCWRGGQRSRSFALVMKEVGWPVTLLGGGYKAFRKRVLEDLEHSPQRFSYRVLAGLTGCGKTEILAALAERGEQVLDLEGLANHQGSLLGEPVAGQNLSQKAFDRRLWNRLRTMDPARPVWTEAESAKIGQVYCPKMLLRSLRSGLRIEVEAELGERVDYLLAGYPHWQERREELLEKLEGLRYRHGHAEVDEWRRLAETGEWKEFVERILRTHYDPAYQGALDAADGERTQLVVQDLLADGCKEAAEALLARSYR